MTTLTHENTVTLSRTVVDLLGLKPGDEIAFEFGQRKQGLLKPTKAKPTKVDFSRLLGTAKTNLTTEQIMALTRGEGFD